MYLRTQVGFDILAMLFVALAVDGLVLALARRARGPLFALPAVVAGAALVAGCIFFATMTIRVNPEGLEWSLTYDLVRKSIPLREIESCTPGTLPRFASLGYHTNGRTAVWNISGSSIVTVRERGDKAVILGTEDPAGVCAAIAHQKAR